MLNLAALERIDYLVIGHLTRDITPEGGRIGGTAAYSALTARALGLRVGIVTSWGNDTEPGELKQVPIVNYPTETSSTFENIYTPQGRIQYIHHVAPSLDFHLIPEAWRSAAIIHLGPVAQEVEPGMVRRFPNGLVGVTPQGWLRTWDEQNRIQSSEWPEAAFVLRQAGAAVISVEDVSRDEERIEEMATHCPVLAVTEAYQGARLYWNGDVRRFRPPTVQEVEATGAGDIFAAAFFIRLHQTRDPWEAARFATQLAAYSVTRVGLENSIPTRAEIQECMVEVLK
jgi:sugar/nucleoside kinase (ribokinase family)